MESRIKTLKNFKLSKKQLNYQNNLALLTILTSLTLPPTKLNIVLNVTKAIENIGRKWYILSDMESELYRRNHMFKKKTKELVSRGNRKMLSLNKNDVYI